MIGIIITGVGAASFMESYSFNRMIILCSSTSIVALLMALIALWKQESRSDDKISPPESLLAALRIVINSQTSRRFAVFLLIGMFSYFMQDDCEMNDIAIFTAVSKTIKKAIEKVYQENNTKTNISKTALEIALKQLL